jgi:hypothetical protein
MKKSAWTDLDQKYFEKIVKVSDVEIEKSAWTDLDQSHFGKNLQCSSWSHCCRLRRPESRVNKMGLLSKLLEPGDRQSVLHFDGLPLTRGAVVATPFADAFSLTFRPVKSTDALAS